MKTLAVAILILLVGVGASFYGRARSLELCLEAETLARSAAVAAEWVSEAEADPFRRAALGQGAVGEILRDLPARARAIARARPNWHLEASQRNTLALVADAKDRPALAAALRNLEAGFPAGSCGARGVAAGDGEWQSLVRRGRQEWAGRKTELRIAKLDFRRDQEIFCQADGLLRQLRSVLQATQDRCARAKKPCPPQAEGSLRQEVADIEARKVFNWEKLQRKWPADVLAGFGCS